LIKSYETLFSFPVSIFSAIIFFDFNDFKWRFSQMSQSIGGNRIQSSLSSCSIKWGFWWICLLTTIPTSKCTSWGYFQLNFSFLSIANTLIDNCRNVTKFTRKPFDGLSRDAHWIWFVGSIQEHTSYFLHLLISIRDIFCIYLILYRQNRME